MPPGRIAGNFQVCSAASEPMKDFLLEKGLALIGMVGVFVLAFLGKVSGEAALAFVGGVAMGTPGMFSKAKPAALAALVAMGLVIGTSSCSATKPIIRSVTELAVELCEMSAVSQAESERAGMSVRDWCAVAKNVKPFVDALLASNAKAELAISSHSKASLYNCPGDEPADEAPPDAGAD